MPQGSLATEADVNRRRTTFTSSTPCVQNLDTGFWHIQTGTKTACGWVFGPARVSDAMMLPSDAQPSRLCDKCFGTLRSESRLAGRIVMPDAGDVAAPARGDLDLIVSDSESEF